MKKKIITTHIDTGGHGYLSVSKKDFILAGVDPKLISGYSGHSLTRIYLEEDSDQSTFMDIAAKNGFEVIRKQGYNLHFKITHNYKPELFHYQPKEGQIVILNDKNEYEITHIKPNGSIYVKHLYGRMIYRISPSNPFEHIIEMVKP